MGKWHCVVSELLGCGTVLLVSCGMWHCVGELLGCGAVSLLSGSLRCEEVQCIRREMSSNLRISIFISKRRRSYTLSDTASATGNPELLVKVC